MNNQQLTMNIFSKAEKDAWRLPSKLTVSQWSDKPGNRMLDPDTSAEPGQYRSARTPYMRGPMDAFTDTEVEEIDVMSAGQVAKSTAIQNMIGYIIDEDPGPTMYVVPREKDVVDRSQKIFKPMVMLSEALRRHITGNPRDLQTDYFTFDRMTLYFAWAGSAPEMAQRTIKYLFFDEPDKYPLFAGREANPIAQAVKRTVTFWDRKIVKMCTPTTELGYINVSYNLSNKQEIFCPCPHCGEFKIWKFSQLKLPKTLRDPEKIIETGDVWYECEVCGIKIYEVQKADLVAEHIWLAEGQTITADGNITGQPVRSKRHSGFNISGLVSTWMSWPSIMADWFRANTEQGIAQGARMEFDNLTLGIPHKETGKKLKASEVRKLTGGFSRATVPADCLLLVASADYHKSRARGIVRIDYQVHGFGYGMRNWVISSGSVPSFEKLDDEVLLSPFPWADGTSQKEKPWLAVMVMFVDSGYEPDDVYEYCRQRPGLTIPTKGEPGPRLKPLQASSLESATEHRLSRRSRQRYRGMQLLIVDTFYFKDQVTSWAQPRMDDEGKIISPALTQFYDEIPSYYFTEFTNEQKVLLHDKRGNARWLWQPVTTGAPTHSLDTAVLCAAAAFYKGVHYLRPAKSQKALPAAVRPGRRPKHRRRSGSGFLDGLPEL